MNCVIICRNNWNNVKSLQKCCNVIAVFMELVGENSRFALHEYMHLITAPLQVIWGKQDQVNFWKILYELKLWISLCAFLQIHWSEVCYGVIYWAFVLDCRCFRRLSDCRDFARVSSGLAGQLWPFCGDGATTQNSQAHVGLHYNPAEYKKCQQQEEMLTMFAVLSVQWVI